MPSRCDDRDVSFIIIDTAMRFHEPAAVAKVWPKISRPLLLRKMFVLRRTAAASNDCCGAKYNRATSEKLNRAPKADQLPCSFILRLHTFGRWCFDRSTAHRDRLGAMPGLRTRCSRVTACQQPPPDNAAGRGSRRIAGLATAAEPADCRAKRRPMHKNLSGFAVGNNDTRA